MERLHSFYFELSNEDRLVILQKLLEYNMNVTTLSREIDLSTQECSRHLSRLSEAELVSKDYEGRYGLTEYGRTSLRLIPGQLFISEHREYFNAHTLERLPEELASRIGELRNSEPTENVMAVFGLVESIFKGAEEHVYMIHDQYILSTLPLGVEALRRGVVLKTLEPTTKGPRRDLSSARPTYISEEDEDFILRTWQDGKIDSRFTDTIDVFLYVSERESLVAFPLADGTFDYIGFHSTDQTARGYCLDIFEYYSERGDRPTLERVEEHHEKRKAYYREKKNAE